MLLNIIEPRLFGEYLKIIVFFEMLKAYDNKLYYNLINKQTNGAEIKNMVLPIFKDDRLYKDVSIFFENVIDCTGKSNEEYTQLIQKQKEVYVAKLKSNQRSERIEVEDLEDELENKEEKENILRQKFTKKRQEAARLEYLIKKLEHGYDDWGEYRLNNLIDTVIKKIEFTDKFNFETV